jgi:hypothetical protein
MVNRYTKRSKFSLSLNEDDAATLTLALRNLIQEHGMDQPDERCYDADGEIVEGDCYDEKCDERCREIDLELDQYRALLRRILKGRQRIA